MNVKLIKAYVKRQLTLANLVIAVRSRKKQINEMGIILKIVPFIGVPWALLTSPNTEKIRPAFDWL